MQKVEPRWRLKILKKRLTRFRFNIVPAHVREMSRTDEAFFVKQADVPRDPAKPRRCTLVATFRHHLHADTNANHGNRLLEHQTV